MFYPYLTPELAKGERAQYEFDGRNMDALQALILLLQYRLTITTVSNNLITYQQGLYLFDIFHLILFIYALS